MVSPLSLYVFAATLSLLAAGVGWLRGARLREALADAGAASAGALAGGAVFIVLWSFSRPLAEAGLAWTLGSAALVASPLGATLALRGRGRRSIPRAFFTSSLALAGVMLWLTLNLRGPRAAWAPLESTLVLAGAALAVAAGACLGWWSKRRTAEPARLPSFG